MPKCIILSAIPCAGKSTWAKQFQQDNLKRGIAYQIISCDEIRKAYSGGGKYKFTPRGESFIWEIFYNRIDNHVNMNDNIIIDNTNLRITYINEIKAHLTPDYTVVIIPIHIKLWKAKLRNYIRYIKTGKWVPNKVMNSMWNNYKNMKAYRNNYENLISQIESLIEN